MTRRSPVRRGYRMAVVDGKRVQVVRFRGQDGEIVRWTDSCSGCTPSYEEAGSSMDKGGGCHECGYTGKRRQAMWVPLPECAKKSRPRKVSA